MKTQEIERLHDRAVGCYVQGRYDEARDAWEKILQAAPDEARALEGVQLLGALPRQSPAGPGSAPGGAPENGSEVMEPSEIEALLRSGRYREALDAAKAHERARPGDARAKELLLRALEKVEAEPFIAGELARAEAALEAGDRETARAACASILSLDPDHSGARALRSRAEERAGAPPAAAAPGTVRMAPAQPASQQPEELTDEVVEDAALDSAAPLGGPLPPAMAEEEPVAAPSANSAAPLSGVAEEPFALDEPFHDEDFSSGLEGEIEAMGQSLAAAPPEAPAPEPAGATSPADEGFVTAPEAGHGSIFEAPEGAFASLSLDRTGDAVGSEGWQADGATDAPGFGDRSFAEIEAEIGESFGAPAAAAPDLSAVASPASAAPAEGASRPAGETAAPEAGLAEPIAQDLSFDDDFAAFVDERSPTLPAQALQGPAERIAQLLEQSRRFLGAGRYSDAIEAAARALAVDPDALGAQELIDEGRRLQQAADRRAEELMDEVHRKLDAGDLVGAEDLCRQILGTHPSHAEARESLERIARTKEQQAKGAVPVPATVPDRGAEGTPQKAPHPPSPPHTQERPHAARPHEPLTPKPLAHAPEDEDGIVEPGAQPLRARPRATVALPSKKRLYVYGAFAAGMAIVSFGGVLMMNKLAGGGGSQDLKAVQASDARPQTPAGRGERGKAAKAAPKSPEAPAAKPVALAAGQPRTYTAARELVSAGRLDEARVVLLDVVRANPSDGRSAALLESVQSLITARGKRAEAFDGIRSAFQQERYEDALRMLYRLPPELQKGDVEKLKADAWFNDAVGYLEGGNCTEAIRCLGEVLQVDPADAEARRLRNFAQGYLSRGKDTDYLRFVNQLQKRPYRGN